MQKKSLIKIKIVSILGKLFKKKTYKTKKVCEWMTIL